MAARSEEKKPFKKMTAVVNSGDEFTIGLLNGMEMLTKHTDGSMASTIVLSAFVKKLAKLEANFGKELSQLCAKDGKKLLASPQLTGFVLLCVCCFVLFFSFSVVLSRVCL